MRLRFDGLKAYVIAIDGQPTDTFEPLRASLPFAPGTRYDLLVDLAAGGRVRRARSTAMIGDGMPLVEIVTAGEKRAGPAGRRAAAAEPGLPDAIRLQNATRKDVTIKGDPKAPNAPWTVNGAAGKPSGAPLVKVKRGTPVVLALTNQTALMQPLHLHGHCFRLLHALDDGWEPYFLDTVQVPENKTIRIAFVADNPGKWLLASTVMERFDAGPVDLDRGYLSSSRRTPGTRSARSSAIRPGPKLAPGLGVDPDPGAGRLEGGHVLRHQPGDEPAEGIAGSGRRQIGRAVLVDRRPAVGRGDHRIRALQHDHGTGIGGGAARPLDFRCRIKDIRRVP